MRFSVAATTVALVGAAQARINGISVPEVIKPGSEFNLIIESSDYIQSVYDVAIAVGWAQGSGIPGGLSSVAGSYYLGPKESNQLHSFNKTVTIPASAQKGKGVVSASLMSLYGAGLSPTLANYNVSVTFGDETSKTYKSSA